MTYTIEEILLFFLLQTIKWFSIFFLLFKSNLTSLSTYEQTTVPRESSTSVIEKAYKARASQALGLRGQEKIDQRLWPKKNRYQKKEEIVHWQEKDYRVNKT